MRISDWSSDVCSSDLGAEPAGASFRSGDAGQCLFLQPHVRMDIDLRRLDGFMPEPKSNDRLIDAMVKQFHSGAVAQGMRGHPLAGEAWAGTRSRQTGFADQIFQGITREWIATDGKIGRESWRERGGQY